MNIVREKNLENSNLGSNELIHILGGVENDIILDSSEDTENSEDPSNPGEACAPNCKKRCATCKVTNS